MIDIEGPLFSNFADRGSSHRRKTAGGFLTNMVWLYRPPIPLGRKGGILCNGGVYYVLKGIDRPFKLRGESRLIRSEEEVSLKCMSTTTALFTDFYRQNSSNWKLISKQGYL
jgi:hypothetical protein